MRDIESAERKILSDGVMSSLVEDIDIDIECEVSSPPQYVIKDDLFETVGPLLALSLVLEKLKLKQIGNGIKIKSVVMPVLITLTYDEQMLFPMRYSVKIAISIIINDASSSCMIC